MLSRHASSSSRGVSSTEFGDLETLCKTVVKEKQPFERLEVTKETLLKMFKVRADLLITHMFFYEGKIFCPYFLPINNS